MIDPFAYPTMALARRHGPQGYADYQSHRPDLYQRLMGYPADLPDLSRLRPPRGNIRPDGIQQSAYVLQRQGTLPACY